MKMITYDDIVKLNPCYAPARHISADWSGTIVDILKLADVKAKDRLWVAVRAEFLTDMQIKQYGLACARMCEANSTDSRVKECNDVVEAFLAGKATPVQLNAARSAAWSAARSAAESAARSAAWSARSAARSAWSAAWSARSAAFDAFADELLKILKECV